MNTILQNDLIVCLTFDLVLSLKKNATTKNLYKSIYYLEKIIQIFFSVTFHVVFIIFKKNTFLRYTFVHSLISKKIR